MIHSQRLQLRQAEKRSEIADALGADEVDDAKIGELTSEMRSLDVQLAAALVSEKDSTPADQVVETSDGREIAEIHRRSSIFPYFLEATDGKLIDGAESELRSALLGDNAQVGSAPIDILLSPAERAEFYKGQLETRVVTPVAAAAVTMGSQQAIAARVFSRSIASRLANSDAFGWRGRGRLSAPRDGSDIQQSGAKRRTGCRCRQLWRGGVEPDPGDRGLRMAHRGRIQAARRRSCPARRSAQRHGESPGRSACQRQRRPRPTWKEF